MTKELLIFISALIAEQCGKDIPEHSNFLVSPIMILRRMGYKDAWGFYDDYCCPRFCLSLDNDGAPIYKFSKIGRLVEVR